MLIASGIAPLDLRLGGIVPGRTYVLSGAPGTGKSLACLEFIEGALAAGERAAMLTHDDPADLLAQAEYLGLDLESALADERLVLLRYQLGFAGRFGRASSHEAAFAELRELLGGCTPSRIVIDSIAPMVDAGTAAGPGISALVAFLESCNATALLTYPGDFDARYDRRLEPLVQRAAAVLHLTAARDRTGTLEIRKLRYAAASTAPVPFVIRPGAGLVPMTDGQARRASDVPEETRRRVLILGEESRFPAEHLQALRGRFDVAVREGEGSNGGSAVSPSLAGVVLVDVRRDRVDAALAEVRALRARGVTSPIALVSGFNLRAVDRTRALRAGADDFFGAELHPDEFLLRVDRLARSGRSTHLDVGADDTPPVPEGVEPGTVLDEHTFRNVVQARLATTALPFFTLVRLTPATSDPAALTTLAEAARASVRMECGDIAGRLDGSVAVYLHSARRKDVPLFVTRIKDVWRAAGGGELSVATAAFPTEESAIGAVLGGRPS